MKVHNKLSGGLRIHQLLAATVAKRMVYGKREWKPHLTQAWEF